jgi:hypothetical protein
MWVVLIFVVFVFILFIRIYIYFQCGFQHPTELGMITHSSLCVVADVHIAHFLCSSI